MSKTLSQINTELTFYQCCIADLAYSYIKKEENGDQLIDCLLSKVIYGTLLLESLKCSDVVLSMNYLTQTELEAQLEQLSDLCGCASCDDPSDLITDTL